MLFGHSEQNCGQNLIHYRRIPRLQHQPGAIVRLQGGGSLPLPAETWAYLWTEAPGLEFSDNCFNEWGLAVACNGCPSKEDPLPTVAARGEIIDGGVGHLLPRLVAMLAKTAREAVHIAIDLINRFGYTGSGRTLTVADANEAWVVSIVRGRHYLAQRVPDDLAVVVSNIHALGAEVDLNDRENVIASPDLVEYATSRGWHDPTSGSFSLQAAYALPQTGSMEEEQGICSRQWQGQALLSGHRSPLSVGGRLPYAVRPSHPLTVADVTSLLRAHLESTDFDLSQRNANGSPHETEEEIDSSYARCACNIATQESVVWQLRSWLPPAIGCLAWRATAVPCTSVFTPWYSCVDELPAAYHDGASPQLALKLEHHFQPEADIFRPTCDSVFWTFQQLSRLIERDYARLAPPLQREWQRCEQTAYALQPAVERVAAQLMAEQPGLARRWLSDYSLGRGLQAWQRAKQLLAELQVTQ